MDLATPVTTLPTVNETVARGLRRVGIRTARDLLFHFPRRHDDRRLVTPLAEAKAGVPVVVRGRVTEVSTARSFRRYRKGTRPVVVTQAQLVDGAARLSVRWLHQQYLARAYPSGTEVYLAGTISAEGELVAPEIERVRPGRAPLHVARLVAVYPETAGVSSRQLRYLVSLALPAAAALREYLPAAIRTDEGLLGITQAVVELHAPPDEAALAAARTRLAFDELLLLQLAALVRRAARQAERATAFPVSAAAVADAVRTLPFSLTLSQERALHAILGDLAQSVPMARLLAGDVGSGKTVVAGLAALALARAGSQTALLAPTEILAQQHAATLTELLGGAGLVSAHNSETRRGQALTATRPGLVATRSCEQLPGLRVGLLTASTPREERAAVSAQVADGGLDLLVGTHALLHAPLAFQHLGLVVVDEQHRFGVLQRGELTQRGPAGTTPHFLSLSATPIPRTLQLTAYGDVDVSPLDPRPGQKTVRTELVPPSARNTLYASLQNRIAAGGQVFVVCPKVEEDETSDRKSVEAEYKRLANDLFRGARIERLHGKMKAEEKARVIGAFRAHTIDLLVASTVVEVGVDIPNADTLLVEGAEHFGLATLHQLRGRVGRRGQDAVCYLASEADDLDALDRLQVLVRTSNGLEIAEEDLRRRGPGVLTGTRQHGGVTLKVASLADLSFLLRVRAAAERLLSGDAALASAPLLAARVRQLNVTTHFE